MTTMTTLKAQLKYNYKEKKMIPCSGDIILVEKKTRGRFAGLIAQPQCEYYVVNAWVNNYGSRKLQLTDEEGNEYYTTDKCVKVKIRPENYEATPKKWMEAFHTWIDKTFVPLIVTTIPKYGGKGPVISRERTSILVIPLGVKTEFWLSKKWMHPDDWPDLDRLKSEETLSVRIPQWLAKKNGIL